MRTNFTYLLPLLLLAPLAARADDLCESRESIHERAMYCHQNWAFLDPATTCVQEYSDMVSKEQARLSQVLNSNIKAAAGTAQNLDFTTDATVLASTIDDVTYLIDYGKQVHTELEDYVYSLTLPIYDEETRGDPSDPETKKRFMESECYSDPVQSIEGMEMRMRPWVSQLEKAKEQLVAMSSVTSKRDNHLDSIGSSLKTTHAAGGGAGPVKRVPSGTSRHGDSTITGAIQDDKLPSK